MAAAIDALAADRAREVAAALVGWSGPSRDRFDRERRVGEVALAALAARCRRLAVELDPT